MKVGKEEWMGLLAAVEQWVHRDHKAEWIEWDRRLATIRAAGAKFAGVKAEYDSHKDRKANVAPELTLSWDAAAMAGMTPLQAAKALDDGEPRIKWCVQSVWLNFKCCLLYRCGVVSVQKKV